MRKTPSRRDALLLLVGCIAAAAAARSLRPTIHLADTVGRLDLDTAIPREFGRWRMDTGAVAALVNPQQEAVLAAIYTQILTRTYVNLDTGYRIMVSIAYGADQSDSLSLHYPDVCYPAQGFSVLSRQDVLLSTSSANLPARRLVTRLGGRQEPVTYWVLIGNKPVSSGVQRKLIQLQYSVSGTIPDGLLFRLSSIDADSIAAFSIHESFLRSIAAEIPDSARPRLLGSS